MMPDPTKKTVIVIGAGMAGLGAAIRLLEEGFAVAILEAARSPGGLAGSFKVGGKYFPLGYHHILRQDRPLLRTLKKLGLGKHVRWKKGKVFFAVDNSIYNLADPRDFFRFPMSWRDKMRFLGLMLYCVFKKNWDTVTEDARTWLNRMAGEGVRRAIFDPLMDIKYGLGPEQLSASWIGSRLHYQEFSKPLGYIRETNWTELLVEKLVSRVKALGGVMHMNAPVTRVIAEHGAFEAVECVRNGKTERIRGDMLINTAPPHIFLKCCPESDPVLEPISYLDALSLILETKQKLPKEIYMLVCLRPRRSFGGIFTLSSLNQSIGVESGTVLNFFTTLTPAYEHLRPLSSEALLDRYQKDFQKLFGFSLHPLWHHLTLIKNYSPRFLKDYRNPDQRSRIKGIYFAGNYLTHPQITSTGSALASGERAAEMILKDYGTI